jgi:hypothetical protein
MNEFNDSPEEGLERRIREILKELIEVKQLRKNRIADYLGLEEKQYSSFYKFIKGDAFPKYLEKEAGKILERLEWIANDPDFIRASREFLMKEKNIGYGIPPASALVWIPFDLKLPVADYNGTNPATSLIKIGEQKGIITYQNTSKYEADGEIYIDTIGMTTDIEPGTRIAIKRINKEDWQTDRYYVIIDASGQISIRELLPGDDKKTIKYISTSAPEGPHMELSLDRIVVIFNIVDGTCIPRPKRNSITISSTQQIKAP